jgi:hypothetical protein
VVHDFFLAKIIPESTISSNFAKKPLGFSKINQQSLISQLDLDFWKIIPKESLAPEKFTKIAPNLQNSISFQPQLQI